LSWVLFLKLFDIIHSLTITSAVIRQAFSGKTASRTACPSSPQRCRRILRLLRRCRCPGTAGRRRYAPTVRSTLRHSRSVPPCQRKRVRGLLLLPALPRQIALNHDITVPTSRRAGRNNQQRNAALRLARCGFSWLAFGDISPATAVTSSMRCQSFLARSLADQKIQRVHRSSGFCRLDRGFFRVEPGRPAGRDS